MSNLLQNCCVCFGNNDELINISSTDTNHVQWSSKLNKCVPEVDWNYDCLMCSKCIQQLEIAYTFYNLCLQSYEVRKQQEFTVKIEAEEIADSDIMNVIKDETVIMIEEVDWDSRRIEEAKELQNEGLGTNEDQMNSSDEEFSRSTRTPSSATLDVLPVKSKKLYERTYADLYEWLEKNTGNNKSITENLLLAYFSELSEVHKTSSLLAKYSMLKATLRIKDNINIWKFDKLLSYLKRESRGYKAKQAKAFTRQDILIFLRDAPDVIYLMKKVIMIIGIAGRCRIEELTYMEMDNVQDMGSMLLITLKDVRTGVQRSFTVVNNEESNFPNILDIYRKYISLRPGHTSHRRLFVQLLKGKCTTQVVGVNAIGKIPSQIAKFLNLPEPLTYTGHSIRRTSLKNI